MADFAEVIVLVEGPTEQRFIKEILAPYLSLKLIFLKAIILKKPGAAGGDIKFSRAKHRKYSEVAIRDFWNLSLQTPEE